MKKLLFTLAAISLFTASAFAFEWGGKIDNNTSFKGNKADSLKLNQKDSLTLWMTVPFNRANTCYLAAEGMYSFEYDDNSDAKTNVLDVNLFKFNYSTRINNLGSLALAAGRFQISDSTGIIFSQKNDGLSLNLSLDRMEVSLYGGYTGLLNAQDVTIIGKSASTEKLDDFYSLADKYIPYGFTLKFPALLANQNLSVQGWGFTDLGDDSFDRYYATVSVDGFISSAISYKANTSFGTVDFENLSNLSALTFTVFPVDIFSFSVGGTYASGKHGPFEPFTGFSQVAEDLSFNEPNYSSIVKFEANTMFNILSKGIVSVGGAGVFNCPEDSLEYKGFQWSLNALWNIFSDFQLGFIANQFCGDNSSDDKINFTLKAAVSF